MQCKQCGYMLGAVAKFCPSCGMTVEEMLPAPYGSAPGTAPAIGPPPAPVQATVVPANMMGGDGYFLMLNGQQSGPFTVNQLKAMWQSGSINAGTYYWQTSMTDWQPLANIRPFLDSTPGMNQGGQQIIVNQVNGPMAYNAMPSQSSKSRAAYIILGLFFGCFGIHNFYAGHSGRGVAQLLITLFTGWIFGLGFFITGLWALIEIIAVNTDGQGLRLS
ncbi:MAG: GYF domain-containing protein [Blastocatellia bacterium]